MKFKSTFLAFTLLILSSNLFATEVNQSMSIQASTETTKVDIQWQLQQDVLRFLTESPDNYVEQDFERIYFQNNCNSTVAIVSRYMDLNDNWVTDGAWKLTPGGKGYLFDTRNSIIYFYGVNEDGFRWQGDHYVVINGYNIPMQRINLSITNWGNYTINLNCR